MTTIDHAQHDHPATKAARAKCRAEQTQYPEPMRPGSVFRSEDGLWQRLVLRTADVEIGDVIAGLVVTGIGQGSHDNTPAVRFELEDPDNSYTEGRLVVQVGAELQAYRPYDPDLAQVEVDIDVSNDAYAGDPDRPELMLNYLLGLVGGTWVQPRVLTWAGPGGDAIVRLTGPRKDVLQVLQVHAPEDWEEILLTNQAVEDTVSQVDDAIWYPRTFTSLIDLTEFLADCFDAGAPVRPLSVVASDGNGADRVTLEAKLTVEQAEALGFGKKTEYSFAPWQHDRVKSLLGAHNSKRWVPTRLLLTAEDKPRKTIFNQDVRDGWALRLPGVPDSTRYVGRELMKALIDQYPHLFDLPEDFQP